MNIVILLGNLGAAPEVKTFENGGKIAVLNLATNKTYRDKAGEKQQVTNWHRVVIKGKMAEVAEKYLEKGSRISLQGELVTRSWEAKGQKEFITEVQAFGFNFEPGGAKEGEQKQSKPVKYPKPPVSKEEPPKSKETDDDLPF